jgi:thymidylate synthase
MDVELKAFWRRLYIYTNHINQIKAQIQREQMTSSKVNFKSSKWLFKSFLKEN